jgi:tetratricopeptide (TPR) repeat protein
MSDLGWAGLLCLSLCTCALGCAATPAEPPPLLIANPATLTDRGPPTDLERGIALAKDEKFAEALPLLESGVASEPKNPNAHYFVGLARAKTGNSAGAESAYKTALQLDPEFTRAAEALAAVYLEQQPPRPDEAIAILQVLVKKRPNNPHLHVDMARAYVVKKDIGAASKHYEDALALGENVIIRISYGMMLSESGDRGRGLEQLRRALASAGNDVAILATLGHAFSVAGAHAECAQTYDKALAVRQTDALWYMTRGDCRRELRDTAGALSDYESAVKVAPRDAEAHHRLGAALSADKKRQADAISELELAVRLGEGTPTGKAAGEKLARMKKK